MPRCEDYPCCGHEPGGCPDIDAEGNEHYRCARCGRRLPLRNHSSLCQSCLDRVHEMADDPTGQDEDYNY